MEAQQCAREPTGTNWPTLHETTKTQQPLKDCLQPLYKSHSTHTPNTGGVEQHKRVTTFAVVIVVGKRPETFRTRKLSPQTPMVLHPTECGRVGHRRNTTQTNPLLDHHSKRGFTTVHKHKTENSMHAHSKFNILTHESLSPFPNCSSVKARQHAAAGEWTHAQCGTFWRIIAVTRLCFLKVGM